MARAELVQEEDGAKKENDPKWKLDDAVQESLRSHGINVQRYWNGAVSNICLLHLFRKHLTLNLSQLAGPDCRRFLFLFGPILSDLASKITKAGHSKAEAHDCVQRHTAVLEPVSTFLFLLLVFLRSAPPRSTGGALSAQDTRRAMLSARRHSHNPLVSVRANRAQQR